MINSIEYLEKNEEKLGFINKEFKTWILKFNEIEDVKFSRYLISVSGFYGITKFNNKQEFIDEEKDKSKITPVKYLPIFISNPYSIDDMWYIFKKSKSK